jgi:hypothetical protein
MGAPKGHPRYGGRQKGTKNKRLALEEFLDKVFEQVDPAQKIIELLGRPDSDARVLLRLMEYRYGQPQQRVELTGADGGAIQHTIRFGGGNES